jgi:hypothetical protein
MRLWTDVSYGSERSRMILERSFRSIDTRKLEAVAAMPSVFAQAIQTRFTAGTTIFADDGAVYETTVGGSARLYFSRRWSVEPEFLHARKGSDRNYFLWGNVAFDFFQRDRRIVPYWYEAPGLVRHTTGFSNFTLTTHEAAFGTGAGVRFKVSDRVFVAPQFRVGVADGVFVEFTGSIGYILRK